MQIPLNSSIKKEEDKQRVTFRQCASLVSENNGYYQKKLYLILAFYWIFASFFISFQYYLYKAPQYIGCSENDSSCIQKVCDACKHDIHKCKVEPENTLTYRFNFFCQNQWMRILYKLFPESLAIIGFLIYGSISDQKGRKIAIKISWRMFTVGIIIYSATQTLFLKTIGYIIACIHCYPSLVCQFVLLFQQTTQKNRIKASLLILSCLFVGPLVLSFIAIPLFDSGLKIRGSLGVFCAIPAFILSFVVSELKESAVYVYRENKILSFNILNQIAKANKLKPILIDLSRSCWKKHEENKNLLLSFLSFPKYRIKTLLGFFFIFSTFYILKVAQISLDKYTQTYSRNVIMNITTSCADITLCFVISRITRTMRYLYSIVALICIIKFSFVSLNHNADQLVTFISSVVVRFCSEICYGILLIWSIESFPTDCRNRICSFVISGSSLGSILAYLLKGHILFSWIIAFVFMLILVLSQKWLEIQKHGEMFDTIKGQLYDDHDHFEKFQ